MRVIVVGAGILGASTAYHLAVAGAEVEILDPELEGRATAAGAGIVCPWASGIEDAAWHRLGAAYRRSLCRALSPSNPRYRSCKASHRRG